MVKLRSHINVNVAVVQRLHVRFSDRKVPGSIPRRGYFFVIQQRVQPGFSPFVLLQLWIKTKFHDPGKTNEISIRSKHYFFGLWYDLKILLQHEKF